MKFKIGDRVIIKKIHSDSAYSPSIKRKLIGLPVQIIQLAENSFHSDGSYWCRVQLPAIIDEKLTEMLKHNESIKEGKMWIYRAYFKFDEEDLKKLIPM